MLRRALEISHALNMRKDIEKLLRQVEQLAGRAQQASV
jgi:hypothetical protein